MRSQPRGRPSREISQARQWRPARPCSKSVERAVCRGEEPADREANRSLSNALKQRRRASVRVPRRPSLTKKAEGAAMEVTRPLSPSDRTISRNLSGDGAHGSPGAPDETHPRFQHRRQGQWGRCRGLQGTRGALRAMLCRLLHEISHGECGSLHFLVYRRAEGQESSEPCSGPVPAHQGLSSRPTCPSGRSSRFVTAPIHAFAGSPADGGTLASASRPSSCRVARSSSVPSARISSPYAHLRTLGLSGMGGSTSSS